jgi:hypothetical protein
MGSDDHRLRGNARVARCVSAAATAFSLLLSGIGTAAERAPGAGAHPPITLPWLATQLIPSPEIAVDRGAPHFGARWQLTPLLYSFGIHRALSPWRSFVVEPIVRESGSVALIVSPEYLAIEPRLSNRFGVRMGLRSTFPVLQRGEYLSVSVGSSVLSYGGRITTAYEVGSHVLFGFAGVLASYSPLPNGSRWIFTLDLRMF